MTDEEHQQLMHCILGAGHVVLDSLVDFLTTQEGEASTKVLVTRAHHVSNFVPGICTIVSPDQLMSRSELVTWYHVHEEHDMLSLLLSVELVEERQRRARLEHELLQATFAADAAYAALLFPVPRVQWTPCDELVHELDACAWATSVERVLSHLRGTDLSAATGEGINEASFKLLALHALHLSPRVSVASEHRLDDRYADLVLHSQHGVTLVVELKYIKMPFWHFEYGARAELLLLANQEQRKTGKRKVAVHAYRESLTQAATHLKALPVAALVHQHFKSLRKHRFVPLHQIMDAALRQACLYASDVEAHEQVYALALIGVGPRVLPTCLHRVK